MTERFPEAAINESTTPQSDQYTFAPGEGKVPENILNTEDWDALAFPMKHPDGRNNLHQKRDKKLTDQYYFIQRIQFIEIVIMESLQCIKVSTPVNTYCTFIT